MEKIQISIAEAFGLPQVGQKAMALGFADASAYTPKPDPDYIFRLELLRDVLGWFKLPADTGLYLVGPMGTGKSSLIREVCARLKWPLHQVQCHSRLEFPELVGHHVVVGGSMEFRHGPLAVAMKEGHVFLLDEIDLLDPATAAGLNGPSQGDALEIPETGEVIEPHPDFRICATGNTAGSGDATGLYQGAILQNGALLDRFMFVEVPYASTSEELSLLEKCFPHLPEIIRRKMAEVTSAIRDRFMSDGPDSLPVTMSTRGLCRWAHLASFHAGLRAKGVDPVRYSLDRALCFRCEPAVRASIQEIAQRVFGDE